MTEAVTDERWFQ